MGMVVRTNTMAMNANRQLGVNNTQVSKSLEKLSSGFKINRAADDASGLAISEKMKAQIKGLEQASANSQDGISLIQTAEGAATEIHDMLNRMTELATKSANGTIQDSVDREAIQREVDDLNSEISRIASSTNFNGIDLLNGNLSSTGASGAAGVPTVKGLILTDTAATVKTSSLTVVANNTLGAAGSKVSFSFMGKDGKETKLEFTVGAGGTSLIAADGTSYTLTAASKASVTEIGNALATELGKTSMAEKFTITNVAGKISFVSKNTGSDADELVALGSGGGNVAFDVTGGDDKFQSRAFVAGDIGKEFAVGGKKFVFSNAADVASYGSDVTVLQLTADNAIAAGDVTKMAALIEQKTGYKPTANGTSLDFKASVGTAQNATGGLTLQVGDTNQAFNKVTVSVDDLSANGIGTAGLDVSTQSAAGDSIQTIKDAINKVSTNRANLGSLQNRLEHSINNLDTTAENMTAANSRIRDTDMAKEMMNYTKMNVLVQSAQAMLAQANQQPQSILQLLQ